MALHKWIRCIAVCLTALSVSIVLPHVVRMFFPYEGHKYSDVVYSELLGDFITTEQRQNMNEGKLSAVTVYLDSRGREYSREQADSLCPLSNASQLAFESKFPDSICGRTVSPKEADEASYFVNLFAGRERFYGLSVLNDRKTYLSVKYKAQDVFRIPERGIEFINPSTNTVDTAKSALFDKALRKAGFTAPARMWWTPSDRNDSERLGYVVEDNRRKLFLLAMEGGQPDITPLALPGGQAVDNLVFSSNGDFLALLITQDGSAWLMDSEFRYRAFPGVKVEGSLNLKSNLLYYTLTFGGQDSTTYAVFDKTLHPVASTTVGNGPRRTPLFNRVGAWIFPFTLTQSASTGFGMNFSPIGCFIWLNLLLTLLTLHLRKRSGYPLNDVWMWIDAAIVLVFGIFGMAGVFALPVKRPSVKPIKQQASCSNI